MIAGRRVGALYRPLKRLPAHDWHAAHGALFETFGRLVPPGSLTRGPDETLESRRAARSAHRPESAPGSSMFAARQARSVRAGRRAFSGSHVRRTMSTLRIGQARYGLLLNENGTSWMTASWRAFPLSATG